MDGVTVLIFCTLSKDVFGSYTGDMISIRKITIEHNFVKLYVELWFLVSALYHAMLYICTEYCGNIFEIFYTIGKLITDKVKLNAIKSCKSYRYRIVLQMYVK